MNNKTSYKATGFFIFFFAFLTNAAENSHIYQPLGRSAYLTSSFGESRGERYHAGVDFSTNKEEGWAVIAPADGVVEFAARQPFGYGRHIKFKARDKHIWVFAHLSDYNKKITDAIKKEMLKKQKASVKLALKMPFKKGDTLAYSGSSGIGDPHLHIERRTPNAKFSLNPCEKIECTDTIAPFILEAAPIDSVFAVKIVDYSREPLENPMSIYSLEVYQNEKNIFSKKYDTLSFAPKQMQKIKEDLIEVQDTDSISDWHLINVKVTPGASVFIVAKDFANNISKKELTLKTNYLKNKTKDSNKVFTDTIAPDLGAAYLKTNFRNKEQCRISVSDSLSGVDFNSIDVKTQNNKWVIFDYDSDPKEIVIEKEDFDFSTPLNIKLCDKSKNCNEQKSILCL